MIFNDIYPRRIFVTILLVIFFIRSPNGIEFFPLISALRN